MVNMVVCVKQVLDPELPPSLFRIDTAAKRVTPPRGRSPVLNPFDENALEAALKVKDAVGGKITVISMGPDIDEIILRETLAAGADDLILLQDDAFGDVDSYATACTLVAAIKKSGEYDIVFCGRQAADTDAGQVGSAIAELMGIPSVTVVRSVEVSDGKARIERVVSDGYEVTETQLPVLVTAGYEVGVLREASFEATMEADEKEVTFWDAQELGVDLPQLKRTRLLQLSTPVSEIQCEMIEGENLEEAGVNLANKLRDIKAI